MWATNETPAAGAPTLPATARRHTVWAVSPLAVLIALIACVALLDTPGYVHGGRWPVPPLESDQPEGDLTHYIAWTRLVTREGLHSAYSGTYPESFAVYGPVVLASYRIVGIAYRATVDPAFEPTRARESLWLRRALKLVALAWHLAAGAAVCALLARGAGLAWAAGAGTLFAANPVAVLHVGHWGQPDGAHALFTVLAVGWAAAGHPGRSGAALALAALAKPQAWAFLPLVGLAIWRSGGIRALATAAGAGGTTAALVLLPFLVAGRLGDLLRWPGVVAGAMPVVSANAHNLWWLAAAVQGDGPLAIPDAAPLAGALSYRAAAALLLTAFLVFVAWLVRSRRVGLAEGAALWATGWFVLTTQAHENHAAVALPLLVLAIPTRPRLLGVLALLTATGLLNLVLQDPMSLHRLELVAEMAVSPPVLADLRTLNASATVALLLAWSIGAARTGRAGPVLHQSLSDPPASARLAIRRSPPAVHGREGRES